mgnify:CR=1 FL=1
MARFSERRPYSRIMIHGMNFYVQFTFVESIKKTECAIYGHDKVCVAKASVTHKDPDEFLRSMGEKEAFKAALDKYMDKVENEIVTFTKNAYSELTYLEKQLTYKLFKMTPLELEHSTK